MLNLNYRDSRPIYEQVKDELRKLVITGASRRTTSCPRCAAWPVPWPSIPNTIQRAYESLEAEGYVYSIPGKGSFAAPHRGG